MDLFGYTLYIDFDEKKMVFNNETAYFAGEEGLSARILLYITVYSIASSQIKYPSYKPDISSYR